MNLTNCSIYITRGVYPLITDAETETFTINQGIYGLLILQPGVTEGRENTPFANDIVGYQLKASLIDKSGIKITNQGTSTTVVRSIAWVLRNRQSLSPTISGTQVTKIEYIDPATRPLATKWYNPDNEHPLTLHRANTVVNLGRL